MRPVGYDWGMPHTVLVVEDELKIRELLRSYLEREGWAVITTGSGAEAITLATSGEPDLIILDLGLPDIPGETVATEVRRHSATPRPAPCDWPAAWPPPAPPGWRPRPGRRR